jgi:hypothetical protein
VRFHEELKLVGLEQLAELRRLVHQCSEMGVFDPGAVRFALEPASAIV